MQAIKAKDIVVQAIEVSDVVQQAQEVSDVFYSKKSLVTDISPTVIGLNVTD